MSVNEGAESGGSGDNNIVWFLYTGQPIEEIPRDVTHVRIAPYVKKIGIGAFRDCEQLMVVELNVGLEEKLERVHSKVANLSNTLKSPPPSKRSENRHFMSAIS